jgi:nitrogen fixation protein FixH
MTTTPSLPKPSDRWIPWYFIAFFIALTAILVPMCVIAVRTNSGVVTENAYEKGLAYNKVIEAEKRQNALSWRSDLTILPLPDHHARVLFTLADTGGHPINSAKATAWFVRPTQAGQDQSAQLQFKTRGTYEAELALPASGLWDVRISATVSDNNYQATKRITLP